MTIWVDLEGILLRNQTEKDEYHVISQITCGILKNKKTQTHAYREQIGSCQRWGLGAGKMGEGGQKVQISSYKICKSWGCNVQHGD